MSILHQSPERYLWYDIETAPIHESLFDMPEELAEAWSERVYKQHGNEADASEYYKKEAGFYPEFSKVVCIGYGFFHSDKFRVKAVCQENEKEMIEEFLKDMASMPGKPLAGFNNFGFDTPFLTRRCIYNGIEVPVKLYNPQVKPWDKSELDLMQAWKCGSFGNTVNLNIMCLSFGLPSPKDGVDGSMVGGLFCEGKHKEIADYCASDVVSTFRLAQCIAGQEYVKDANVVRV